MINHNAQEKLMHILNEEIVPFAIEDPSSYQSLIEKIGDARIVLIGEATHGTEEFYQARIELSKYLIKEKNFHAIAIEGDWPTVYPIHRYLQGEGNPQDAKSCLKNFKRFPTWMWANSIIPSFLKWLRQHNDQMSEINQKISFYGLDLYSLSESIHSIIEYLKLHDPATVKPALERYACFDHTAYDPEEYAYLVESGLKEACIKEVNEQFLEMQHLAFNKLRENKPEENNLLFYAMQNARLVKNAEHYYRALFESREETWNIRDRHMAETLQNLISFLETKLNMPAKIIVWAHNSHVGDARATEMSNRGEVNLGQLIREQFSNISFHIGFSTYSGTVTAASEWDEEAQIKTVLPALKGSYEELFHELRLKNFILFLHLDEHIVKLLNISRLQRAIGVIYRPDSERFSHYFFVHLPYQFDAIIHIDNTTALKTL